MTAPDVTIKASVQDDTKAGLNGMERAIAASNDRVQRMADRARSEMLRKQFEAIGGSHFGEGSHQPLPPEAGDRGKHNEGGGHFGRIFSDQSTTGLDPLGRGLVGAVGEHLGMGLALGGAAVGTKVLGDMTGEAIRLSDALHNGAMRSDEIPGELAKSIPIFGQLYTAAENIRELATHEKQLAKEQAEINERNLSHYKNMLELRVRLSEETLRYANANREAERAVGGIGLRGSDSQLHGLESERQAIRERADQAARKINRDFDLDAGASAESEKLNAFDATKGQRLQELLGMREKALEAVAPDKRDANRKLDIFNPAELVALQSERDDLEKHRRDVLKGKIALRDAALGDVSDTKKNATAGNARDLAEARKLIGERLKLEGEVAASSHAESTGATMAARLATAGQMTASHRLEIQTATKAAADAERMQAETRTNATTNAGERATIAQQLAQRLADITARGNAQLAQLEKDAALERKRISFGAQQAELDAGAAANAQRLREAGQGYDADAELRQRDYQKRLAEIDEQAAEEIARNKDNAVQIRAKADADKRKAGADFQEGQRQAMEGKIAGQWDTAKGLINGRVEALRQEAAMGNIAAAGEAKRLEIASQFADKRAQLNKMIRDPNVGRAEKELAQQELDGLDERQKKAMQFAFFTGAVAVPGLSLSSRGSGAAQRAKEENSAFIQLQRMFQRGNPHEETTAKNTTRIVAALDRNPVVANILKGIN